MQPRYSKRAVISSAALRHVTRLRHDGASVGAACHYALSRVRLQGGAIAARRRCPARHAIDILRSRYGARYSRRCCVPARTHTAHCKTCAKTAWRLLLAARSRCRHAHSDAMAASTSVCNGGTRYASVSAVRARGDAASGRQVPVQYASSEGAASAHAPRRKHAARTRAARVTRARDGVAQRAGERCRVQYKKCVV